jgi:hypothetical protein
LFSSAREVLLDVNTEAQVVGNRGIDVRQVQHGVVLRDLLRGSASLEGVDDGVESDTGPCHSNDTVFPERQGDGLLLGKCGGHLFLEFGKASSTSKPCGFHLGLRLGQSRRSESKWDVQSLESFPELESRDAQQLCCFAETDLPVEIVEHDATRLRHL